MCSETLTAALSAIRSGLSILPIDHRSKKPIESWKRWQTGIADNATVGRWFVDGAQAFGVVCGGVSGGLVVFDFDEPGFYERWLDVVGQLAKGLPVQRTGGGGYQVFLRCDTPCGNLKLAWARKDADPTGRAIAIETRGKGGYVVVAPSLHPSGGRYQMLSGSLDRIPLITQTDLDSMLEAAGLSDECPLTRHEQKRAEVKGNQAYLIRRSGRKHVAGVIDAFNDAHPIDSVLLRNGYTRGAHGRLIRPGGRRESVSIKDGRSCHWSSNDPLNDSKIKSGMGCHDAFDVYTHFDHGGDVRAAVRAAAKSLSLNLPDNDVTELAESHSVSSVDSVSSARSVHSEYSVDSVTIMRSSDLIRSCVPTTKEDRKEMMFRLARGLKFHCDLSVTDRNTLRQHLRDWRDLAFSDSEDFDATWDCFLEAFKAARYPLTFNPLEVAFHSVDMNNLPAVAGNYDTTETKRLIGWCAQLANSDPDQRFFLSCRTIEQYIPTIDHMTASRRLKTLANEGVIEVLRVGSGLNATRFRWIGGQIA